MSQRLTTYASLNDCAQAERETCALYHSSIACYLGALSRSGMLIFLLSLTLSYPMGPEPRDNAVSDALPVRFQHHIVGHVRECFRLYILQSGSCDNFGQ